MINYILDNDAEADRLEAQACQPHYDVSSEFRDTKFERNETILDAGCGSGVASRYLATRFAAFVLGMDYSMNRLKEASLLSKTLGVKYIQADLLNCCFLKENQFDKIICRFVLQHNPSKVREIIESFLPLIKPSGKLIIIDVSHAVLYLDGGSPDFKCYLSKVRNYLLESKLFNGDVSKIIRSMTIPTGLQMESELVLEEYFSSDQRTLEAKVADQRLAFSRKAVDHLFEQDYSYDQWACDYIGNLLDSTNEYFFKRHIFTYTKL